MPNLIRNIFRVSGTPARIAQFKAAVATRENQFDFDRIIEQPQQVLASLKDEHGICPHWYAWRVEAWGTKWNSIEVELEETRERNSLCYSFDTAWSTPIGIWDKLFDEWQDLRMHIEYADEDIGYNCGILQWDPESREQTYVDKTGDTEFCLRVQHDQTLEEHKAGREDKDH